MMNQKRRDVRMVLPIPAAEVSVVVELDIFFALLGDKAGGPHGEH